MIKDKIVASRYAEAFINYARPRIGIEKALLDLRGVKNIMREHSDIKIFLGTPQIALTDKLNFIDKVFSGDFSPELRNFLKLLIEKGRTDYFLDISEYIRVKYSHAGKAEALLKSAYPLDLAVIKKIEVALEEKFNKKFKFYLDFDSSLLGGVQILIGNTVIDGSVRRRLDDLREKLMAIKVD